MSTSSAIEDYGPILSGISYGFLIPTTLVYIWRMASKFSLHSARYGLHWDDLFLTCCWVCAPYHLAILIIDTFLMHEIGLCGLRNIIWIDLYVGWSWYFLQLLIWFDSCSLWVWKALDRHFVGESTACHVCMFANTVWEFSILLMMAVLLDLSNRI